MAFFTINLWITKSRETRLNHAGAGRVSFAPPCSPTYTECRYPGTIFVGGNDEGKGRANHCWERPWHTVLLLLQLQMYRWATHYWHDNSSNIRLQSLVEIRERAFRARPFRILHIALSKRWCWCFSVERERERERDTEEKKRGRRGERYFLFASSAADCSIIAMQIALYNGMERIWPSRKEQTCSKQKSQKSEPYAYPNDRAPMCRRGLLQSNPRNLNALENFRMWGPKNGRTLWERGEGGRFQPFLGCSEMLLSPKIN